MSQVIKNGKIYRLANVDQVKATLPIGTYNLAFDSMSGFYLEETNNFTLPKKIYGDTSIIDRSIKVYKNRDRNFGLLLSGLRGAGKSLLMRKLAIELCQPIIIVNSSFSNVSDQLIAFLTDSALGDCTILFDEFEKRFDESDVTPLTLMDGPYNTHHFFILTVNTTHINENLLNRPGRIYYHKTYKGLDDDTIREVGEDLLINKDYIDELINVCGDIRSLSFDMLISVINDVNLFNQSPKECIKIFGFESGEGMFARINQITSSGIKDVLENPIWLNPSEDRYVWVTDCVFAFNDGTTGEVDLRLDLSNIKKISKTKYHLSYELTANKAALDSEERKKFTDQILEFEINLSANKEVKYIF